MLLNRQTGSFTTSALLHALVIGLFLFLPQWFNHHQTTGRDRDVGELAMGGDGGGGEVNVSNIVPSPPMPPPVPVPPVPTPPEPPVPTPPVPTPPEPTPPVPTPPEPDDENVISASVTPKTPPKPKPLTPPVPTPPTLVRPTPPKPVTPTPPTLTREEQIRRSLQPNTAKTPRVGAAAFNQAIATLNKGSGAGKTADRIGRDIRNGTVSISSGHGTSGGGGGGQGGDGKTDDFYAALMAMLYDQWRQPSRGEVGAGRPVVVAEITIRADGTVEKSRILKACGSLPMNQSVAGMLEHLIRVTPPSRFGLPGQAVTVNFQLDDKG